MNGAFFDEYDLGLESVDVHVMCGIPVEIVPTDFREPLDLFVVADDWGDDWE